MVHAKLLTKSLGQQIHVISYIKLYIVVNSKGVNRGDNSIHINRSVFATRRVEAEDDDLLIRGKA